MVHSADSRIQGHAFRCPLFSPAVRDHASTNPASFSPWARPQAKRCSTTKALPNHRASGWTCSSIHCLPREVRGQKKTVPSLRTRTSGYSGQVATNCSWMRAPFVEHASGDQNRKSAFAIRRCRGDRLHSAPHPPFGLPPFVSKRRLVALSRCPDADCNCTRVSDRVEWHESWERNSSRSDK